MKKVIIFCLAIFSSLALVQAQTTIAQWTFETSLPAATDSATISGIAPEVGSGEASGVHASAATDWSNPVGNGSAESFSSNEWSVGDYYQFRVSTVGFQNISVSYDQISSGTGPGRFDFAYSTDGVNFTTAVVNYTVIANTSPNAWSSTVQSSASSYTVDLTSVSDLNNQANVFFRLINNSTTSASGGTVAPAGTDRVDNFTVVQVPEPSTYALMALGVGFFSVLRRRK